MLVRCAVTSIVLAAAARAQCGQMPNECCPPDPVMSLFSATFDVPDIMFSQFDINQSMIDVSGPLSATMMDAGTTGLSTTTGCALDPTVRFHDAGRGETLVATYGNVDVRIPLSTLTTTETGLSGLARLYQSVLVVDGSYTAWDGSGTHLKSFSGQELPVPAVSTELLVEGASSLQPRPAPRQASTSCRSGTTSCSTAARWSRAPIRRRRPATTIRTMVLRSTWC